MLTLEEIKYQLRLEQDDVLEDPLLTGLGLVAWEFAQNRINSNIYPDKAAQDIAISQGVALRSTVVVTPGMKHAMLMMVAHFYTHREPTTAEQVKNIPFSIAALLDPYRVFC